MAENATIARSKCGTEASCDCNAAVRAIKSIVNADLMVPIVPKEIPSAQNTKRTQTEQAILQ